MRNNYKNKNDGNNTNVEPILTQVWRFVSVQKRRIGPSNAIIPIKHSPEICSAYNATWSLGMRYESDGTTNAATGENVAHERKNAQNTKIQ